MNACGTRIVYNVICGVNKRYETTNEIYLSSAPCDLAQEGSAAEEAAISNNEEDAEAAQQQAAAAAAAAAAADK